MIDARDLSWSLVRRAAKYSGTIDYRTIASVDAVGRIGTLADTVSEAWVSIQNMYEAWRFLRVEFPDDGGSSGRCARIHSGFSQPRQLVDLDHGRRARHGSALNLAGRVTTTEIASEN